MTRPEPPTVRVVVVDHDGGALTVAAVGAIFADGYAGPREVVLVDNASRRPVVDELVAEHPRLVVRRSARNLGFGGGCNLGIGDPTDVDLVALVNNDAVVEPGWLDPLVAALEADDGLAAVMPKVVLTGEFVAVDLHTDRDGVVRLHDVSVAGADDGVQLRSGFHGPEGQRAHEAAYERLAVDSTLWAPAGAEATVVLSASEPVTAAIVAGGAPVEVTLGRRPTAVVVELGGPRTTVVNSTGIVVTTDLRGADRGWLDPDDGRWDEPAPIDAWSGSAVLLRATTLAEVGGFDERLFMYCEDLELSWRAARAGWRFAYAPGPVVRHRHSATAVAGSTFATYHKERNRLLLLARHAPAGVAARAFWRAALVLLSYARRDLVRAPLHGEPPSTAAVAVRARALAGALRFLPGALASRRTDRRTLAPPMVLGREPPPTRFSRQ